MEDDDQQTPIMPERYEPFTTTPEGSVLEVRESNTDNTFPTRDYGSATARWFTDANGEEQRIDNG